MPGLLRGVARTAVVAGTASAVSGRVQRRQADKFADRDAHAAAQRSEAYAQETGAPPAYAPPPTQYGAPPQQVYAAPPQPQYAPEPAAPAAPASQADVLTQLKQLGELRDAGVLTEAEFAGQKAKLLG
jgi:Short C-terminal domain